MVFSKTLYSGITTTGKEAFGSERNKINAGDYIQNKTAFTIFCNADLCKKKTSISTNSNLILLKRAYLLSKRTNNNNKNNLTSGLNTSIDLGNQRLDESIVVITPSLFNRSGTPYLEYVIDPSGTLFGNTICGINNIENFRIPN